MLKRTRCASVLFFFFQAEDGIRDTSVTGVQTCALPISAKLTSAVTCWAALYSFDTNVAYPPAFNHNAVLASGALRHPNFVVVTPVEDMRSEERRVGKECR